DNHAAVALSATQSNATIHEGRNSVANQNTLTIQAINNPGIDKPVLAFAQFGAVELLNRDLSAQINTSFEPVLLTNRSIAHCRSSTEGLSYAAFVNLNYVWKDAECWYTPYLGGGCKIEIAPEGPENTCPSVCTSNAIPNSLCGFCDEDVRLQIN